MPKTSAPVALSTPWPSTMASASQSLADPSAKAMPSTINPISRVRRSRQIASRERQPVVADPASACCAYRRFGRAVAAGSGCRKRMESSTAAIINAPMTARCTTIGDAGQLGGGAEQPPRMVPPLNKAWNSGMTVRPSARSLAAPSTFIETSHIPMPRPKSASPVTTSAAHRHAWRPTPVSASADTAARDAGPDGGRRADPGQDSGWTSVRPTMEPAASPKTIRPISKRARAERVPDGRRPGNPAGHPDAGQREDHEHRVAPRDDLRAGRGPDPAGWPDAGAGWDTVFLRFCFGTDVDLIMAAQRRSSTGLLQHFEVAALRCSSTGTLGVDAITAPADQDIVPDRIVSIESFRLK